jgi:signal peptidase I
MLISAVLFVLIASFSGWHFDVVPTTSMEPAFSPGGMVVARPVEMEDIKVGDPILFTEPNIEGVALICHRVIDIEEIDNQLSFQTKGDANEYPDSGLVSSQNFVGKTIFYAPHVGNIAFRSHLHETPIVLMGKKISVASLIIVVIGLIIIGAELENILEWILTPHLKRRQEILKKRRHRLKVNRRRVRALAG